MERIELEYDDFYTQIGKLNRISDLPNQIEFKVSQFAKIALPILIIGGGLTLGIFIIRDGRNVEGWVIILISIAFYLLLYLFSHRSRDKKYGSIWNAMGKNI